MRSLLIFLFTFLSLLLLPAYAQESSKQQAAKTDIKPASKPPATVIFSAEESKTLRDLTREAENADLRQQLLSERIRAAQVELEKLQQASKEATERIRQALRTAAEKGGIPPNKLEEYDISEEKGLFVLKLKSFKTSPKQ